MKTKFDKTTSLMMITAALIGTIGIGAQSAFADTIDFETDSELDDVGSVVTATNTVTFKVDDSSDPDLPDLPDGVVVTTGADTYGFSGISEDGVTGQSGVNSLSNNIAKESAEGSGIGNWNAFDYVILFDTPVENLRLDVYDFGDYPSVPAAGSITLNVYSDSAATVLVGSDSVDTSAAGNDSIVTLSVPTPSATILSAKVVDSKGDVGTAIDNVEFDFYDLEKELDECDSLAIQKNDETTECSFTITYEGPEVTIEDAVPAEWEVKNPEANADCTVEPANKGKKANRSATEIVCEDVTSLEVTYELETRLSPGQGHIKKGETVYKPTFCGILEVNDGAIALNDNLEIVATTDPLLMLATVDDSPEDNDCDGDGHSDAKEFNDGTDPSDPNDPGTGCGGDLITDFCVDGDGIASPLRGAFTADIGDPLTTWPTSFGIQGPEGIDWFDTDASNSWTLGDDIHLERTQSCATGISDGNHDPGFDCTVLDLDSSLVNGQPVSCDLETGTFCGPTRLLDLSTTGIKFLDDILVDGNYTNSEDIILDLNGDGIFN